MARIPERPARRPKPGRPGPQWPTGKALDGMALCSIMMEAQNHPSRDAVSVLSDGRFTELYVAVADPHNRDMTSQEFFERHPDLGGVEFLKRVNWKVPVPAGAELFSATSGQLQGDLNAFWLGWREARSVSALSVFQDGPIRAPLNGAERLIPQPIITPGKKLYYYFWRGGRLGRLEFSGELGQAGSVAAVELSTEREEPALSASRAVPGSAADESVMGLVDTRDGAVEPAVLFVSGKSVKRAAAEPLAGHAPFPRQHMGMHVGPQGAVTVAFLAEHRESKAYTVVEATCERGTGVCRAATRPLPEVRAGTLHSAAPIYYERLTPRKLFVLLLDKDGNLSEISSGGPRQIRSGVDLSYSFPILATMGSRYEARFNRSGSVDLIPIE